MKANDIALALTAKLQQITVANGYLTDIGLRVYRGRRNIDATNAPCITLIEGEDTVKSDSRMQEVSISQQFSIEAHDVCDPNNPNDKAHQMIADMKRALFSGIKPGEHPLGGLAKRLEYKGRNIAPREDGQALIAGAVLIDTLFVEDLANP